MKARYIIIEDEHWELKGMEARVKRLIPDAILVGTAMNGCDGLSLARAVKPDIAITDIKMPQMDGLELAKQLHETVPDLSVLIVSGFNEFAYAQQAIVSGVCGYLLKPINDEEFMQAFRHAYSTRIQRISAQPPLPVSEGSGTDTPESRMRAILDYVNHRYAEDLSVRSIARFFIMDESHLSREFKRLNGMNLSDYIRNVRLDMARKLLATTRLSNAQVSERTGFHDPSYFYRAFCKQYGQPPGAYRAEVNRGERSNPDE